MSSCTSVALREAFPARNLTAIILGIPFLSSGPVRIQEDTWTGSCSYSDIASLCLGNRLDTKKQEMWGRLIIQKYAIFWHLEKEKYRERGGRKGDGKKGRERGKEGGRKRGRGRKQGRERERHRERLSYVLPGDLSHPIYVLLSHCGVILIKRWESPLYDLSNNSNKYILRSRSYPSNRLIILNQFYSNEKIKCTINCFSLSVN